MKIETEITGDKELLVNLDGLARNLEKPEPFFKAAASIVIGSSQKNFIEEGRPTWPPLSPVTVLLRGKKKKGYKLHKRGKKKGTPTKATQALLANAKPLRDSGVLMASIGNSAAGGILRYGVDFVEVGTAVKYARIQQNGGITRGFIPGKRIPARPYLVLRVEDTREIFSLAEDFVNDAIEVKRV